MRRSLAPFAYITTAKWSDGKAKPILSEGKRSFFRRRHRARHLFRSHRAAASDAAELRIGGGAILVLSLTPSYNTIGLAAPIIVIAEIRSLRPGICCSRALSA
jgi:hypothetical protein